MPIFGEVGGYWDWEVDAPNPPFTCPACGERHFRLTAHGELRTSAVQERCVLCDNCLAEAKADVSFAARTDL